MAKWTAKSDIELPAASIYIKPLVKYLQEKETTGCKCSTDLDETKGILSCCSIILAMENIFSLTQATLIHEYIIYLQERFSEIKLLNSN